VKKSECGIEICYTGSQIRDSCDGCKNILNYF